MGAEEKSGGVNALLNTDRCSLIHGLALPTLQCFPKKSFGLIVTDPPYSQHVHENLGKERRNDGGTAREALTFPPMTEGMMMQLAAEFVRVCTGWIIIFSDFYLSHKWGQSIVANGGAWVRTGQWVKTSPMPQMTGDRPACGAEDIVICHSSPDTLEGRRLWDWNGKGHAAIWRGPRDQNPVHPNQKPEWLLQTLLGQFAPPGATALDPFFGSGTTGAAALSSIRIPGEVCLETACTKCARKRAEEYAPPLPVNVNVVGIEGDINYALPASQRILRSLGVL